MSEARTPVLQLEGVSLSLRGRLVLEDIDWTLHGGEFIGLIGPNGAGKTILLKIILGLLDPDVGTVRVEGRSPREARGRIAYVPQYAVFDREFPVQVLDVVLMGRLGPGFRGLRSADHDRAFAALRSVDLTHLARRQIGRLSGGELQRVLIARALVQDAPLILLDEPDASLDTRIGGALYDLLGRVAERSTVIVVTHDVGVIDRHVTSVACLNRRLHYHGTAELTQEMIEATYGKGVDVLEHPHSHRLLADHPGHGP